MGINALTLLKSQCANHILANQRLMKACIALPEAAYMAKRPCFFGTIHATLDHIVTTDDRYLDRLSGTPIPPNGDEPLTYLSREAVAAARQRVDERMKAYVSDLSEEDLAKTILLHETERWGRAEDPVWVILQHVFAHGTHHRGQIHDLLSQTNLAPPQLDEFFLSMDRPFRIEEVEAAGVETWMA